MHVYYCIMTVASVVIDERIMCYCTTYSILYYCTYSIVQLLWMEECSSGCTVDLLHSNEDCTPAMNVSAVILPTCISDDFAT